MGFVTETPLGGSQQRLRLFVPSEMVGDGAAAGTASHAAGGLPPNRYSHLVSDPRELDQWHVTFQQFDRDGGGVSCPRDRAGLRTQRVYT